MDISCRPWSLNTFALTKVWFKCHTVDLRVSDISSVTSKVKSRLFQDQLEKPTEMVLHRPIQMGGLGLHSVKSKALASLIRTFMETAANLNYTHNLYHTLLYRVYVLNDDSISNPPALPPYYSAAFFDMIRQVKSNTPLNVSTMSTAQWYRVLVEQNITMIDAADSHNMEYIKTRAELASPATDWECSWRRARLKGLGSEATSFLWKLLHLILPTEERLSRILPNTPNHCKYCPNPITADIPHCLFMCVSTREVGSWLLSLVRKHDHSVTPNNLVKLEFQAEDSTEMPLVWIISQTLLYMWGVRASGKTVSLIITRATLESKISLLRETRYRNEQVVIQEIFEQNL